MVPRKSAKIFFRVVAFLLVLLIRLAFLAMESTWTETIKRESERQTNRTIRPSVQRRSSIAEEEMLLDDEPAAKPAPEEVPISSGFPIDRIFYFSSFVRQQGTQMMEDWLSTLPIPHTRIESITGIWGIQGRLRDYRIYMTYKDMLLDGRFVDLTNRKDYYASQLQTETNNISYKYPLRHTNSSFVEPYYNLSGTVMVIPDDNITIPNMEIVQNTIQEKLTGGDIPEETKMIRVKCCRRRSLQSRPLAEIWIWKDSYLQTVATERELPWDFASKVPSHSIKGRCLCESQFVDDTEPPRLDLQPLHFDKIPLERIQLQEPARIRTEETKPYQINHVYYCNLEKNVVRREAMDFWMNSDPLIENIPKKRINASVGDFPNDQCVSYKNEPGRCRGIAGLAKTFIGIIDNEDMSGISLVLEDDYFVTDPGFKRIIAALEMVPDDWDLIRLDCKDTTHIYMQWMNPFVASTTAGYKVPPACDKTKTSCFFCGGTHAMLWREESVAKIREVWARLPYDDVDCVIARNPSIKSYCINIGAGDLLRIESEESNIPKTKVDKSGETIKSNTPALALESMQNGGKDGTNTKPAGDKPSTSTTA